MEENIIVKAYYAPATDTEPERGLYRCARAVKGVDFIHLYNGAGKVFARFEGISDFAGYSIENSEWDAPDPTQDETNAVLMLELAKLKARIGGKE